MNDSLKQLDSCKKALTAVEFAINCDGSGLPVQEIIERVISALEGGTAGLLGKDLAVILQRLRAAPAQRAQYQLGE